jgi:ribosomal protein S27AE
MSYNSAEVFVWPRLEGFSRDSSVFSVLKKRCKHCGVFFVVVGHGNRAYCDACWKGRRRKVKA